MIAWGARERTTTDGLYLVIVIETARVFVHMRQKGGMGCLKEFYLLSKSVLKTSKNINSLFQSYDLTLVRKLCAFGLTIYKKAFKKPQMHLEERKKRMEEGFKISASERGLRLIRCQTVRGRWGLVLLGCQKESISHQYIQTWR